MLMLSPININQAKNKKQKNRRGTKLQKTINVKNNIRVKEKKEKIKWFETKPKTGKKRQSM